MDSTSKMGLTAIYILFSVLSSTLINLIFKSFQRFKVDKVAAIVVNYLTCVVVAAIIDGDRMVFLSDFYTTAWFPYAFALGILFIAIFYLIGLTNQVSGVSVAASASKLGVVIPVIFGVFLFEEKIYLLTVIAIIISLISVVLISQKKENGSTQERSRFGWILLPLGVLIGSGIIETTLKYIQHFALKGSPESHPTTIIFASAAVFGIGLMIIQPRRRAALLQTRNWVSGIALGIPNYFSIWFLLLALNTGELTSVVIYPLNNIAIVAVSTIASVLIFSEKLSAKNIIGLVFAIISIIIIASY